LNSSSSPSSSSSSFTLVGIPSLQPSPRCLGILFCSTYITALLGNGLVLLVIALDPSLRDPLHCFLAMLATVDVAMVTSIVPTVLRVLWRSSAEIGFPACMVQMFFIHSSTSEESGVLLAMAVDRYVAICHPLRYQTILNRQTIALISLAILLRGLLLMLPMSALVIALPYCQSRRVAHSYCEHAAVAELACADHRVVGVYSLAASSLVVGMDVALIAVSYGLILRASLGRTSRAKTLGTCGSHLCVLLLYYGPGIVSIYAEQFRGGGGISGPARVLLAQLYVVLPTLLNPIIYSLRTE
ncbi:O52I1 protein, partial [Upupa epops]|nr:O52I1 protein [Upupa epops]